MLLINGPEEEASYQAHQELFGIFGERVMDFGARPLSRLLDVQAVYNDFAERKDLSKQFVLVAGEGVFTSDGTEKNEGEERAILMVPDTSEGPAYGVVKAAAILIRFFDSPDRPSFLKRLGGYAFRYLPQIRSIEWAVWMSAVREKLTSIGSAA